ncbi:putative protease [Singulisphaera sp. GP187]|uniref:U32 family peptidase n=1 Tax=Singulisphaera sp. GP187 TaxID=1882752 RepID=UPI00092637A8|nr:U32 family peptidase [Singulisphaera sp. GP187]SIN98545.1 putative protease [Singulisphaera sp. GP187]
MAIAGTEISEPLVKRTVKPELLAPAGDRTCLIAAVENGADAVYFGLQRHNARARATNFDGADLPDVMNQLHRRGVRGYVTLNTLVFPRELSDLEETIRHLVEAGVDAVIVQDLGLVRLIRALTPDLEIHASTQMSITSTEGVRLARELGCSRVILARELSLAEIARIGRNSELPLEVFVHGALCVAYSGQCLTSEALGGRSANRGECAQACRMPYEIVCDGELQNLDDVRYLLSPQDLAAFDLIPELIDLGVASLKIEGRLKAPEYVANITQHYRRAIDAAWAGQPIEFTARDVREMELSFSRGFSHGFLDGNNHKVLVRGDHAKKRGIFLGRVTEVAGAGIRLDLTAPVKPGDGLVFDAEQGDEVPEQGGRVYEVLRVTRERGRRPAPEPAGLSAGPAELRFGQHDLDPRKIRPGQRVWKTDDPELTRRLRKSFEGPERRKVELDIAVRAVVGEPLRLEGRTETGREARCESTAPLDRAERQEATAVSLQEQLDRLGGSIYQLRAVTATIEGGPMVPKSLLNALRRDLVAKLDEEASRTAPRSLAAEPVLPVLRSHVTSVALDPALSTAAPSLSVLCRDTAQVEAAVAAGIKTIYVDYQDIKRYKEAVAVARRESVALFIATPRIQKPAEANLFRYLEKQGADGLLVRNAGGLYFCTERGIPFVADFSLNASNELTVELLKARGALRVTASYDLCFEQLEDLMAAVPSPWLEIVIHQQIPMFHMEHCVFCAVLSPGTDKTNCGRPCDDHDVKLRDRVGKEHPLKADVGCRNTLFNAVPQSAAEYLPRLLAKRSRHLRIEFLDDSPEAVGRTIALYANAIAGRSDARSLWRELKATSRYGVTRGSLSIL